MSYQITYGSYAFPSSFHIAATPYERSAAVGKLPRVDGGRVPTGYLGAKRIQIAGQLHLGPLTTSNFRTRLDALYAALNVGPTSLNAGDSDRTYRDVQVLGVGVQYPAVGFGRIAEISIDMVAPDPFTYSTTTTTDTWSAPASGDTKAITPGGNAYTLPVYNLKVDTGSATFAMQFECTTTGEVCTLSGSLAHDDVVVIDARQRTVKLAGVDAMALFEGEFPRLLHTASTLKVTYTTGTLAQVQTVYQARWW